MLGFYREAHRLRDGAILVYTRPGAKKPSQLDTCPRAGTSFGVTPEISWLPNIMTLYLDDWRQFSYRIVVS